MNFHVGQKVVFVGVGNYPLWRHWGFTVPERGHVYTIRMIRPDPTVPGLMSLLFNEIVNPATHATAGYEPAFVWSEYRPVVERKTDISIFTKMLNTKSLELVK